MFIPKWVILEPHLLAFMVAIRFLICLVFFPEDFLCLVVFVFDLCVFVVCMWGLGFVCLLAYLFVCFWLIFSPPCYITQGCNPGQALASSLAEILLQ